MVGGASVPLVAGRLHHAAICVADMDASLRFWRDGVGLAVLMDHEFEGDWPALFGARSRRLRSVFLGDPAGPEAGIVELVAFVDVQGQRPQGTLGLAGATASSGDGDAIPAGPPAQGFFLLSFFVDVDEVLGRLVALGLAADVRRIEQPGPAGPVAMATVRDPDGVLVELIGAR